MGDDGEGLMKNVNKNKKKIKTKKIRIEIYYRGTKRDGAEGRSSRCKNTRYNKSVTILICKRVTLILMEAKTNN